ncbi:MAG: hypothetical protein WC941_03385 [Candidatus Bathyarchaeia archaeon]
MKGIFPRIGSHPSRGDLLHHPCGISEKEPLTPYGSALFST